MSRAYRSAFRPLLRKITGTDPRVLVWEGRIIAEGLKNPGIFEPRNPLGFTATLPLKIGVCPLLRVQVIP